MGYIQGVLCTGLILALGGHRPSGIQSLEAAREVVSNAPQPEILAVVQVDFQHIGRANSSVLARLVTTGTGSLVRAGGLSFTQGTHGSFTGPDHMRYLYGQLNVNNIGAPRRNLMMLGVNIQVPNGTHTLGDTSLLSATRANGIPLTALEARKIWPTHRRELLGGEVQVVNNQADFQAYREADITPAITSFLAASPFNGYAFPFGFMIRSKTDADTRLVPTGTAAGTVTIAFRYPDENPATTTDNLTSVSWIGLIVEDSENRETADSLEADTTRACAAAQTLYGGAATVITATLRNVVPTGCGRPDTAPQDVRTVRISGRAASPTTTIP